MTLLYPVLAQIFWTFVVILMAGRSRVAALRNGVVRLDQIALGNDAWPTEVRARNNNMQNQFETPILFYALAGAAMAVGATGWLMTGLAWLYVISRVAHTLVHTGGNDVITRFRIFVGGMMVLIAMWAGVVLRLIGLV